MNEFEQKILKKLDDMMDVLKSIDEKLDSDPMDMEDVDDMMERTKNLIDLSSNFMKQAMGDDDIDDIPIIDNRKSPIPRDELDNELE